MSDDIKAVAVPAGEEASSEEAKEQQVLSSEEDPSESEPEPDVDFETSDDEPASEVLTDDPEVMEEPEVEVESVVTEEPEPEVMEEPEEEASEASEEETEKPTAQAEGDTVVENEAAAEGMEGHDLEEIPVDDSSQQGGDSSKEVKVPPFRAIDPKSRTSVHDKLRAYENRRRTSFQAKLESSSLYWRSFRDLLQSSIHETARAERLVLGTAKAQMAYANAMQASYEDGFLDNKGQVILEQKRQRRLSEQRIEGANTSIGSPSKSAILSAEERKANMLTTIMEAQLALATKFGENAKELEEEIASELTNLRQELEAKVNGINNLGDAILSELEKTETEISEAWETYYSTADKAAGDINSPAKSVDGCNDLWVVEMLYRVGVAYQLSVWEKASTELSALFASMKETECQRRIDLREFLLAFTQRQERLYLSLPEVYTPPLKDLVGRDIDRNSMEEKVQVAIRRRAELLQREEASTKTPVSGKGSGLTRIQDLASPTAELESPLMSELLCKAKVIDRKLTGLVGGWKTTLAVVTADQFLHLFDLPSDRVHSGSAPEVAFQTLTPTVRVPTAETMRSGKINFVRGWCDGLVPADSLALDNCKISSKGTTFELVETYDTKGASKMFGKKNTRKVVLRTVTEEETQDWMDALKAGYI